MSDYIDLPALGQVLLVSLIAGAGLAACFSLGVVGWSAYAARDGAASGGRGGTAAAGAMSASAGLALAVVCFAVCIAGVAAGLYVMFDK